MKNLFLSLLIVITLLALLLFTIDIQYINTLIIYVCPYPNKDLDNTEVLVKKYIIVIIIDKVNSNKATKLFVFIYNLF